MNAKTQGLSLRDLIDKRADETPDRPFLVDPDSADLLTYGALREAVRALGQILAEQNVQPGDTIGYAMHNGIDTAKVILGLFYGGYLATAINLVSGKNTIAHVLTHSRARIVFCQAQTRSLIEEAVALNPQSEAIELLDVAAIDFQLPAPQTSIKHRPGCDDDGLLMYTSGTTGVPKGVVLTHGNLIAGGTNAVIAHELTAKDRGLCVLPLYHINGLCVTLLGALASGSSLIMPQRFSVTHFWDQLRSQKGTWFSVVPTQISYLLNEAVTNGHVETGLEQVRFGRSASAPLSPDVQQAFERMFQVPIIETMGLTETAAQILSNPMHGTRKIGSPGIAYGNDIMVADGDQRELPRCTEGEVLVRGPNVMKGYLRNHEATQACLLPSGWLRTGDLGRMDADGFVFITGRLKELIIKGGENIAPREVDEALYSHPDVIEAAAFGRACPQYGQRVEAGVKLRDGSSLEPTDLIALCQERLGKFKAPDSIHVLPELPKGPSGKIQRTRLQDLTA